MALTNPEVFETSFKFAEVDTTSSKDCACCLASITFDESDLILGDEYHNRPLYVSGLVGDTSINRILLDCGSAVNLLPLRTLQALGMNVRQLTPSMLTIQGFNQVGQKAMGSIVLQMEIGELYSDALFHVIDADTSYNVLLGRPWLHTYGIVPSTLHQCFKFLGNGGVKKVLADTDPFRGEEVNYADAKFYKQSKITFSQPIKDEVVQKESQSPVVEKAKSSRLVKIASPKTPKSRKMVFNRSLKDQREPEKKAMGQIQNAFEALVTSYTKPLLIINQSIPGGNLIVSTNLQRNNGRHGRIVSFKRNESSSKVPLKVKAKRHKAKKSDINVTVHQGNGMLRAFISGTKNHEFEGFTNLDKAMLTEEASSSKPPRVSVFQRLGKITNSQPKKSQKSKKWRVKCPKVIMNRDENNGAQENVQDVVQVSMIDSKEGSKESDNNPIAPVKQFPTYFSVKKKNGQRRMCASFRAHNNAPPLLENEAYEMDAESSTEEDECNVAQVNCITVEDEEEENGDKSTEFINNAQPAPPQIEDGGQATVDELREINLGTDDEPKPIFVSALLTLEELEDYKCLLQDYQDVFAWGYQDMPGLDPKVAVHRLAISKERRYVKQAPRRFRPELEVQIKAEIDKLIDVGFIREVKYPTWLASIVPVKKKNGQIRICIDFRDLNDACPKDEFPLPIIELLVDATTGFEALSFMDGFSGYNQIKMAPEDEELTAFRTPKGVYCYTVMPFGLKNAGATYQRAMTVIFNDMLHNSIECYVDDLVVKTRKRERHLNDLKKVFDRLRKNQLKMNPLKCAFGVTSGKFLGFVVRYRGIEVDPSKIKAIMEMPPPRNLRELRGLQGRLAYIRRFISNLSGRCQPFTRLMRKDVPFVWDDACQNALSSIKEYLLKPPVLMAPIKGKPLILYIAALERSLGAMLAQNNEEGKENALYYLSRTLVGAEQNYTPIEKVCLALVFTVQKLRHYLLSHSITLISKADPLRYLMSKPVPSGRLAKWSLLLSEFEIKYVSQKAIKGQALADFLAAHPVPDNMELPSNLPDEEVFSTYISQWQLYFDGAARKKGAGAGIVFITPCGGLIPYSFSLMELCSNNAAEYEALIIGLEIALELHVDCLQAYGDSQLIVKQMNGQYAVKNENLTLYHERAKHLVSQFQEINIAHIPRSENNKADALAKLAASLTLPEEREVKITVGERHLLPSTLEQD